MPNSRAGPVRPDAVLRIRRDLPLDVDQVSHRAQEDAGHDHDLEQDPDQQQASKKPCLILRVLCLTRKLSLSPPGLEQAQCPRATALGRNQVSVKPGWTDVTVCRRRPRRGRRPAAGSLPPLATPKAGIASASSARTCANRPARGRRAVAARSPAGPGPAATHRAAARPPPSTASRPSAFT